MTAETTLKKIEIDTSTIKDAMNYFIKKFNEDTDNKISDNKSKIKELEKNFENALSKLEKESKTKEEANEANEGQYRRKMKELREDLENQISKLEKESKKREKDTKKEISTLREELQMKEKQIETFVNDSEEKKKKLSQLEIELREKGSIIENLRAQMKKHSEEQAKVDETLVATRENVKHLEKSIDSVNKGTTKMFTNGVMGFLVDTAKVGKSNCETVYSPYFYSHANGYKLRLEVHPSGDGKGAKTHISVYLVICKGEYDDILPWPCKYSFSIALINKVSQCDCVRSTLHYISDKVEFNKPTTGDNPRNGFDKFFAHSNLSVYGVEKDNSVLIECIVSPPRVNFDKQ